MVDIETIREEITKCNKCFGDLVTFAGAWGVFDCEKHSYCSRCNKLYIIEKPKNDDKTD